MPAATSPLRYEWDFGDGSTALGNIVSHRYEREGEETVRLSVGDGLSVAEVTGRVSVRSLTGFWRPTGREVDGVIGFEISQSDVHPVARLATDKWVPGRCYAILIAPRQFGLSCEFSSAAGSLAAVDFLGEVDASLQRITGTLQCLRGHDWGAAAHPCGLEQGPGRADRIEWPEALVRV